MQDDDPKFLSRHPWLREPLFHFIALGLLVFAIDNLLLDDVQDTQVISIDQRVKDELVQEFQSQRRRTPTEQELERMVQAWLQAELLYRKGLDLGLDRNDPVIRERIIQKTEFLLKNLARLDEPDEQQLRQWYTAHAHNYQKAPRYDFEHVLTPNEREGSQQQAQVILQQLLSGKQVSSFGEDYHKFVARQGTGLKVAFGQGFVDTLAKLPQNQWQVVQSKEGWHVVRLLNKREALPPPFEKIRPLLRADWYKQKQREHVTRLIQELRERYIIERGAV